MLHSHHALQQVHSRCENKSIDSALKRMWPHLTDQNNLKAGRPQSIPCTRKWQNCLVLTLAWHGHWAAASGRSPHTEAAPHMWSATAPPRPRSSCILWEETGKPWLQKAKCYLHLLYSHIDLHIYHVYVLNISLPHKILCIKEIHTLLFVYAYIQGWAKGSLQLFIWKKTLINNNTR